jgi:exopolyphosphatase/guanosine-5'-triphosphate,3'-diphosphate pyrophosphatase
MKLGVLDLGSNSFQLLAAEAAGPNEVVERGQRRATLCLEASFQKDDVASELAEQRAFDAVGQLLRWARARDPEMPIIGIGKTGLQDTERGSNFLGAVQRRYGISVELLSGEDEAKLTYRGVRSRLLEIRERLGVIDIGGGSVEIGVGQRRFCLFGSSLPLGFLRIQSLETSQLVEHVDHCIGPIARQLAQLGPERWVFSGGTSRAFGRLAIALGRMTGGRIAAADVLDLAERIQHLDETQLANLGVPESRIALFPKAAVLLASLVNACDIPAIGVSTGGLRQGVVLREYERLSFTNPATEKPQANRDRRR